ncbi:HypC/HybG/HupF family hydrogenase formation chaperone [Patescibacteria group bacterium]|nr:HypC/HybG/HupF family hydrogenase formation chaperone [Patescibacteria group bacterium]MBU1931112.1 HypC/HybG/HupF family hydrogenase formation chaperone [Patescibacteria group bacterium]
MCLGIPGKVIAIKGHQAKVELPDHCHWLDVSALDETVKVGDYLLAYQDTAINKVSPQQARETLTLFKQGGHHV